MEDKESHPNIVKIVYKGETRKYHKINSYNDIIISIAKTLGLGVLNCRFVYIDDDNDEITVSNDDDLHEAFRFFKQRPPKLTLSLYSEVDDISLSQIKLCQSDSDEGENFNELMDKDSDSEREIEEISQSQLHQSKTNPKILPSPVKEPNARLQKEISQSDKEEITVWKDLPHSDENEKTVLPSGHELTNSKEDSYHTAEETKAQPGFDSNFEMSAKAEVHIKQQHDHFNGDYEEDFQDTIDFDVDAYLNIDSLRDKVTQIVQEEVRYTITFPLAWVLQHKCYLESPTNHSNLVENIASKNIGSRDQSC